MLKGTRGIVALFGLGALVAVMLIAAASASATGSLAPGHLVTPTPTPSQPPVNLQVQGTATGQTVVGQASFMQFNVVNKGSSISNLAFKMNDGQVNWLDQHTITNAGSPCSPATSSAESGWLLCGPVQAGGTTTIKVTATAKTVGSFTYDVAVADLEGPGDPIRYAKKADGSALVMTWSEKVLAT